MIKNLKKLHTNLLNVKNPIGNGHPLNRIETEEKMGKQILFQAFVGRLMNQCA